ncbi:hypothetical protein, partial [Okeania sp.]|uniref:hypothetical protein n=1 Tax=Okeania sp. TaxID=3100323 RepID=UPI002B4B5711
GGERLKGKGEKDSPLSAREGGERLKEKGEKDSPLSAREGGERLPSLCKGRERKTPLSSQERGWGRGLKHRPKILRTGKIDAHSTV